jgi:hypothetical protein
LDWQPELLTFLPVMNKEKKKQKKKDADPRITLRVISRLIINQQQQSSLTFLS